MERNCLIGIDVGTSAVKAMLIDAAGNELANVARPVAMWRPGGGHAEQNATDWTDGVLAALTEFASQHDLSGLAGIGITSQVNTHVFVGSDGAPLIPAITWQDTRCAAVAAALTARLRTAQQSAGFG